MLSIVKKLGVKNEATNMRIIGPESKNFPLLGKSVLSIFLQLVAQDIQDCLMLSLLAIAKSMLLTSSCWLCVGSVRAYIIGR